MKLAIFGGTGRVGRRLIEYGLAEGHSVVALVRDPSKLAGYAGHCQATAGDVLDPVVVEQTLAGADAVLSAIGGAGLTAPGQAISGGMRNIVAVMHRRGIRRIIAVAGSGVLDSPRGGLLSQSPDFPPLYTAINQEHLGTWEALRQSPLEWTLACTPDLVDGMRTGSWRTRIAQLPEGAMQISVEDTAAFMVSQVARMEFLKVRVGLAY
jgi:putative NADH-flavin reductase